MALPHPMILNFCLPSGEDHIYSVNEIVTFQQVLDLITIRCHEPTAIAFEYDDENGRNTVRSDDELLAMMTYYFEECQRRQEEQPFPLFVYPSYPRAPKSKRNRNPFNLRVKKNAPSLPTGIRTGSGESDEQPAHTKRAQGQVSLEEIVHPDKISRDDLQFLEVLGHGNGGTVHRAMYQHHIVAVKVIALYVTAQEQRQIMAELDVLHKCNSDYIIQFYGAFFTENRISICTEYMDGGSLDRLGQITEKVLGRMTVSVVKGLQYLWDLKIMHRDIKPSNMLVNTLGQVKLCDFGVSVQLDESMAKTFTGTNAYMSPERIMGEAYSFHAEIWSLGLSLVEMAIGRFPYPADGARTGMLLPLELLQCIVHEPPPALSPDHFSANFVNFCSQCLQKVPATRIAISSLMLHPFLVEMDDGNIDMISIWVRQRLNEIHYQQQAEREAQQAASPYVGQHRSSLSADYPIGGDAIPIPYQPGTSPGLPSLTDESAGVTEASFTHPLDDPAAGWCS